LLNAPRRIQVASQKARLDNIEQRLHYVDDVSHKNRLLDHLLRDITLKQAIVFTATKRDADTLADSLSAQGHEAAALHGDMSQRDRNRTLTQLRHGGLRVLVATDVAARGIDVAGITHVINFDLPKFAEDYVHRIGRTGRAGASGIAVSFASGKDNVSLKKIEHFTGQRIASHVIPGLEPRFKPRAGGSGMPRNTPNVAHKRSRSWSPDNQRHVPAAGSARGDWGDSRGRSFSANRTDARGNTVTGNRSSPFGNGRADTYFRSK
jgi:superfamily II DNA/RNA helicase